MTKPGDVTITKLDADGEPVVRYPGHLVFGDETVIVACCTWSHPDSLTVGDLRFDPGDIFIEFYYRLQWFNIFQVYDTVGSLKGWYCNVARPVEISLGEIRWQDLSLDLVVLTDGECTILDQEEFEKLPLSPETRRQAECALDTLKRWTRERRFPFTGR